MPLFAHLGRSDVESTFKSKSMFHASEDLYFIKTIVLATVADGCFLGNGLIFFIGTFWVVLSIVDHFNLVPFLELILDNEKWKKNVSYTSKTDCFKWKQEGGVTWTQQDVGRGHNVTDATALPSRGLSCVCCCAQHGSTAAAGVLFVIQKRCLRHCWGLCLAAHFAQLGDELHPLGPSLLEGCKLLHQR